MPSYAHAHARLPPHAQKRQRVGDVERVGHFKFSTSSENEDELNLNDAIDSDSLDAILKYSSATRSNHANEQPARDDYARPGYG